MSLLGDHKVIHAQTREVVFNVYNYFYKHKNTSVSVSEIKQSVHEATGVSVRTIERIIQEGNTASNSDKKKFTSPGKKRPRRNSVRSLPEYQIRIVRDMIYDFHRIDERRVTVSALRHKMQAELEWEGSNTSLRRILTDLGFKFRCTQNNRKVLLERLDIRALRIDYLQKIKHFRDTNRPIVYIDETYIHSSHTSSKMWTDESTKGLFRNISKGPRLIIVHAGGNMGFIPNALLIFKSGVKTGDYHSDMNAENYGRWLEEKLTPNLPTNSVVVIDNAPYHNTQENHAPTSNSRKNLMIEWLTLKGIPFDTTMLKPQLYQVIKRYKDQYITYKFDEILQRNGHTVLRLPPYHPDLNPIELIWATVKNNVAARNINFKMEDVRKLTEEEFSRITQEDWQQRCKHVVNIEDKYLESEILVDETTESLIINVNNESDSDDDDFSSEED